MVKTHLYVLWISGSMIAVADVNSGRVENIQKTTEEI